MDNYKIIKFKENKFEIDVNVSPEEDTVWLTQEQIARLFERDKTVITRHINNIYREKELDKESTSAKNASMPLTLNRKYETYLYNLDVIISVGYRVKSKRGVLFRKWANNVLKEYLIKGYAIDKNRSLITKENYLNLYEEVSSLRREVKDLKKQIEIFNPIEKVLVENQIYTAFVYINALLRSAEKRIIIVDGYLDDGSLEFFVNVNRNIDITLITHKTNRFTQQTIKRFKDEFINTTIIENKSFHDRFLIIDETVYSLGTSLNNLGRKLTTITLLDNTNANDLVKCVLK